MTGRSRSIEEEEDDINNDDVSVDVDDYDCNDCEKQAVTTVVTTPKQSHHQRKGEEHPCHRHHHHDTSPRRQTQRQDSLSPAEVHSSSSSSCQGIAMMMGGWGLTVFVVCVFVWVAAFNVLSGHSDVSRYFLYPSLTSVYFEDTKKSSGARVMTYLVIFYILAGAVTMAAMGFGIRIPKPPVCFLGRCPTLKQVLRKCHLVGNDISTAPSGACYWTYLEVGCVVSFVAMTVGFVVMRFQQKFYNDWDPDWTVGKLWYEVCKTLGKIIAMTMTFLFLPVSKKGCFWLDVLNYKFERAIKFHRWLSWFFVWVTLMHVGAAVASLASEGQFINCMWPSSTCQKPGGWGTYESFETSSKITYGWITFLLFVPLIITSFPWFRRHKFEWFYYTHMLFIPAMMFLHFHFPHMIYYAAPGLAAYILDKVIWFCTSRRPVRLLDLYQPAPGYIRAVIATSSRAATTYEPGDWIQINIPAISYLEWHPMSIAKAPSSSSSSSPRRQRNTTNNNTNTMEIDIKVLGDWTSKLEDHAKIFNPSNPLHSQIYIDGFHGSSHSAMQGYLSHPCVVMMAGGIGVTPMMPALRQIVNGDHEVHTNHVRRLVFVWVVRKLSVLDLYRDELTALQAMKTTPNGCQLKVLIYATLKEEENNDDEDDVAVPVCHSIGIGGCDNNAVVERVDVDKYCNATGGGTSDIVADEDDEQNRTMNLSKDEEDGEDSATQAPDSWTTKGSNNSSEATSQDDVACSSSNTDTGGFDPLRLTYFHKMILTIGSGCAYLLGIFLASYSSYEQEWKIPLVSLLQLCLCIPLTAGISMLIIYFFKKYDCYWTSPPSSSPSSRDKSSIPNSHLSMPSMDDACGSKGRMHGGENLHVKRGRRPNVDAIINDVKKWCIKKKEKSVGVAVCGPDALVHSTMESCRRASKDSSVQFVVDEETFEW